VADLASLRISVDSREVNTARTDLLSLGKAAESTNKSVVGMGSGFSTLKNALAGLGLGMIVRDIASTNAEFQRLQAALTVATGSTAKAAQAFNMIRDFAKTTPYELDQSVNAFLRLKNLGLDPSMASMKSYGNTAAAMGKDLMQMVEAVADASTGEFERLKEFGIKASKSGDQVAFTFQGVTTTVKASADEIQNYLLKIGNNQFAGGMEMQMQTLGGQFSNLKDSVDALEVAIGNAGANNVFTQLLVATSDAVAWATENVNLLSDAFTSIAVSVGAYYAATLVLNVAQKAYAIYTAGATAATIAFNAAIAANPIGLIATGFAAAAGYIYYYSTRTKEATNATTNLSAESKNLRQNTEELNRILGDKSASQNAINQSKRTQQEYINQAKVALKAAEAELARWEALGGRENIVNTVRKRVLDLQDAVNQGWLTMVGGGKASIDKIVSTTDAGLAKVAPIAAKHGKKAGEDFAKKLRESIDDLQKSSINIEFNIGVGAGRAADLAAQNATDIKDIMNEIRNNGLEEYNLQMAVLRDQLVLRNESAKLALDTATSIGDLIGGSVGKTIDRLAQVLNTSFPKAISSLGEALGPMISSISGFFKGTAGGAAVGGIVGGGGAGGTIGGALGQKLGEKIFSKLGSFAGPLGAIAGGLLGGLIGGLFSKTKTGTATLHQIAGGAMQKTLNGNNAQLKGIADKMASGLLTGLGNIAEQLGGTLGGAVNLSIGMRKNDYVLDPTGQGRTKGAGVINFGTDQAAAVAYATQLAIQQGIITGLSAGADALIKAGGDLNAQVQKALKFDQVFKDLKKETDPLGASLDDLLVEMNKMKAIFDEAGASAADYAKLEELYAIKQAKAVYEAAKPRRELEIALLEAQGNAVEALAANRALELEGMDASLRGLQQQVWAAEDAKKASEDLASAQAKEAEAAAAAADAVAAFARDRQSLEIALMEATGNASGALAAQRAVELAAMDESLRGLQEQVWAAQDAAKAQEAAAAAAQAAADETAKAVAAAAELAAQKRDLEIQLMEAQGFAEEALAAKRAVELASMDASLRGLKDQIWAAEAKAAADAAAAQAAQDAAAAEAKAAQDAADALQKYQDALANVSETVVEEINRLRGINASSSSVLLKAQFATLTAQARTGNLDALGKLPELSKSIEQATMSSAGSALEVARIRAWLGASLSETLAAQSGSNASVNTTGAGLVFDGNTTTTASTSAQTADALSNMRVEMYNALYQVAKNTGKSYELLDRWDGNGLPDIREDASDYY
jgi:hypothetical protein